jgi:DNA repair photolyase
MSVIYQPSGRAAEYAEWACNLFRGCPHQCAYCFAPDVLRRTGITRYEFHRRAVPRKNILAQLTRDAKRQSERRLVHLCFTCDPYPRASGSLSPETHHITQSAIYALKDAGHGIQILTKGGMASTADIHLLDEQDEYATTLTLDNRNESRLWEPFAALPEDRVEALNYATSYGVIAWASLEPVIYPEQSLRMLDRALGAGISKVKIGPLNYRDRLPKWLASAVPENVDWKGFVAEARKMCGEWGVECILKNDLKVLIGEAE